MSAASNELSSAPSSPSAADGPILMLSLSPSPPPPCSSHPSAAASPTAPARAAEASPRPAKAAAADPLMEAVRLIGGELGKGVAEADILDAAMVKDPLFSLLGWWLEDGFPDGDRLARYASCNPNT